MALRVGADGSSSSFDSGGAPSSDGGGASPVLGDAACFAGAADDRTRVVEASDGGIHDAVGVVAPVAAGAAAVTDTLVVPEVGASWAAS